MLDIIAVVIGSLILAGIGMLVGIHVERRRKLKVNITEIDIHIGDTKSQLISKQSLNTDSAVVVGSKITLHCSQKEE